MASETKLFGMPAEKGRWILIILGFIINLCLGSVYAYSVFKVPVQNLFKIGAFDGGLPFMFFIAFFAGIFPFSGRLLEKIGPKKLGILGGIIVGLGWILSGIIPAMVSNVWTLVITYGVIAGAGVGLSYSGPIQVATRWFPDKKGLAVGLTVAGFGGSPFVSAYIASNLINSVGVLSTFLYLGIAFLAIVILLALPLKFPAAGWKPAGWSPKAGAATAGADYDSGDMAKTTSFWGLFICFIIGSLAGLMAIGISSPVATGIIKLDTATAATLVGVFAIFRRRPPIVRLDNRQDNSQVRGGYIVYHNSPGLYRHDVCRAGHLCALHRLFRWFLALPGWLAGYSADFHSDIFRHQVQWPELRHYAAGLCRPSRFISGLPTTSSGRPCGPSYRSAYWHLSAYS
jgi:MFS family permease